MVGKKSQVMIFVILGVVILFIFAFLFSFMSSLKKQGLESQEKKKISNLKVKKEFKGFVSTCLDNSAKEALYLVGRQGSKIYEYQAEGAARYRGPPEKKYGEYVLPYEDRDLDRVYNVSYGIKKPRFNERHHPPIPQYPYGFVKLVEDPTKIDANYVNVLGNFPQPGPLTPLCDYHGKNGPGVASIAHSCETYDSRNEFVHRSVQEHMEAYVTNQTVECAKQNAFRSLNASINASGANTSILFSNNKIHFTLNFPATISLKERTIETDLQAFSTTIENRLKLMHEFISHLIEEEVNNIFFDMVKDAHSLTNCRSQGEEGSLCLKDGMSVEKIRNPCQKTDEVDCEEGANSDDILMVKDEKSYLYGEPYEFYFAIENRPPALDLVYQQEGKIGFKYDFVSFVGNEIVIKPKAYDPDESFHGNQRFMQDGYEYGMWKEDYNEEYRGWYCNNNPDECQANPGGRATKKITSSTPRNWSSSEKFQGTGRVANYVTDQRDWGKHTVKVSICDDEGLCDYQKVTVFVGNIFSNQSFNPYSDIPNGYASVEDPYTLMFPNMSTGHEEDRFEYKAVSPSGENRLYLNRSKNFTDIPGVDSLNNYNPSSLKEKVNKTFPTPGDYDVSFRSFDSNGDVIWSSSSPRTLEVKECLPHNADKLPYPFTQEDYWQADHACCQGDPENPSENVWGKFADDSTTCYSEVQKGCFANFSVPTGVDYNLPSPSDLSGDTDDAYKFELEVNCSGEEGMSCTGPTGGDVNMVEECGVCQDCKAGKEGCVQKPSFSFVCDDEFECSKGEYDEYDVAGGVYSCQGACSPSGNCDAAINCSCDYDCGAGCEENWYKWDGKYCKYNCGNDCKYKKVEETNCSAPSSTPFNLTPRMGETSFSGLAGVGAIKEIDTDQDNTTYASVCQLDKRCHFSVCSDEGTDEFAGEKCLDPGKSEGDLCYTAPGPKCNASGGCTSVEELPFENNPDGDKCYYNISCNVSGWEYKINASKPSGDNWTNAANTTCYYGNPTCDNQTGWVKYNDTNKPMDNETVGDICYYNPHCTDDGWARYNETKPSGSCPTTFKCTSSGWRCI